MKVRWLIVALIGALVLTGCAPLASGLFTGAPSAGSTPTPAPSPTPEPPASSPVALSGLEDALASVYTKVAPSVVHIRVEREASPFGPGEFASTGSGFVWDKEGHIVTNNHVVEGARRVWVTFEDGTRVRAEVVGRDPDSDLAVLRVEVPAERLRPVTVGDSTQVRVGQIAIAIGNPFGLKGTMTVGVVSALGRVLPTDVDRPGPRYVIPDVIQTDAAINPGNSGGVLVDLQGRLIGVTSAIISPVRASAGIGFAIPSVIVQKVVPKLIEQGYYEHPWVGIEGATLLPEQAEAMNLPPDQRGVLVVRVLPGSPADEAGLRGSDRRMRVDGAELPVGGDVIVQIDDQPVRTFDDLVTYLARYTEAGQEVTFTVLRDGQEQTISLVLGARPRREERPEMQREAKARAWLGIRGLTLTPELVRVLDLPTDLRGVLVVEIVQGSPADKAGLRGGYKPIQVGGTTILAGGDVIVAVDGEPVPNMRALQRYIALQEPGREMALTVYRDGQEVEIRVVLEPRPETLEDERR